MKQISLYCFLLINLCSFPQERTKKEEVDYEGFQELYMPAQSQKNDVINRIATYDKNVTTKLGKGSAFLLYGFYFTNKDLLKADSCFHSAKVIFTKIEDERALVSANSAIAVVGQMRGDYKNALKSYFEVLEVDYIKNDSIRSAKIYNNIATVFYYLENNKKSIMYYEKALAIFRKYDKKSLQSIVLCKLGDIYYKENKDRSKKLFNEAYDIYVVLEDTLGQIDVYSKVGNLLIIDSSYSQALDQYQKAYNLIENNKNYKGSYSLAAINKGLGSCYFYLNAYPKARKFYDEALYFYKAGEYNEALISIYPNLSKIEAKLNNFKKAFEYQSIYRTYQDSLYGIEKIEIIGEIEAKYQTEKKEKELLAKEKHILSQSLEIDTQKSKNKLFIFGLVTIGLILLIISYFYKQKTILNRKLTELNHFKSQVFKVIGHDLRSPISNIVSSSKENETIIKASNSLSILDELLVWGNSTLSINEKVNVGKIFHEIEDEVNDLITAKALKINIKSDNKSLITNKDELIIIIRNLLNNAVKYSKLNSEINIEINNSEITIINPVDNNQKSGTKKGLEIVKYLAKKNNFKFETEVSDSFKASLTII